MHVTGEFRRAIRAAGVDEELVDDTAVRRIFMHIDRDNSGTVELEEMIETLTDDVLQIDDPITRMLMLHKGAPQPRRWRAICSQCQCPLHRCLSQPGT